MTVDQAIAGEQGEAATGDEAGPPAVVVARFSGFRTVPSRGVAVLVMDVPDSRAAAATDVLGSPMLGMTIHVAFTRLQREGEPPPPPPLYGTFEKMVTVAARKALSLTIEMPSETSHPVLKQLGYPTVASDHQIAIVRLHNAPERPRKPNKTPGELAVIRCAIRIKDEPFQRFILGTDFIVGDSMNEVDTDAAVKQQLDIKSKRVLREDYEKLREWWAMESRYEQWLQNGGLELSIARDAR